MSSRICGPLGSEFLNANDFKKFFTVREFKYINKNFEVREKPPIGCGPNGCETNLFFGFFFEGTRNNYIISEKNISAKDVVVSIA